MIRKRTLIRAALVAAFAVASPSISAAQGGGGNNQGTGQVTFGNLIAALNNVSVAINQLNALNNVNVSQVRLVNVQNLLNGNNVEALNNALNRNNVEILNLRNVLTNNSCSVVAVCNSLNNVLNNNNVAIGQVVALSVLSGGNVILFYQPQQP